MRFSLVVAGLLAVATAPAVAHEQPACQIVAMHFSVASDFARRHAENVQNAEPSAEMGSAFADNLAFARQELRVLNLLRIILDDGCGGAAPAQRRTVETLREKLDQAGLRLPKPTGR